MPRTITGVTDSILNNGEVFDGAFIKIESSVAPYNTLRLTDIFGGFIGNIDGTSQTWKEDDFTLGTLSLNDQNILTVNQFSIVNSNRYWTDFGKAQVIRGIPITIYMGIWDATVTPYVYKASVILFKGTIDEAQFKEEAIFSLKPHTAWWSATILYNKLSGKCINDFMNPEDCQFPFTPGLTCAKTRTACRAFGNEININSYDDMPKVGEQITYSNKSISTR